MTERAGLDLAVVLKNGESIGDGEPLAVLQGLVNGLNELAIARSLVIKPVDVKEVLNSIRQSYGTIGRDGLALAIGAAVQNGQIVFDSLPDKRTLSLGLVELEARRRNRESDSKMKEIIILTAFGFSAKDVGEKKEMESTSVRSKLQKIYNEWGVTRYGAIACVWRMIINDKGN